MKCPLMLKRWQSKPTELTFEPMNCLKEKCEWWDAALEGCIVKSLFCELASLSELAAGIKEKLPNKADLPE